MNIEALRQLCLQMPHVTEDVKWGANLCFLVAEKIFCITDLEGEFRTSLKVPAEHFDDLVVKDGIAPAPYLARGQWITVGADVRWSKNEWIHFITQSYDLIFAKLPAAKRRELTGSA